MKQYKNIILLELYAVVLAFLHMPMGVVTDEAKYLLNIPYPHPPLARWIFSMTEWMPMQELFWRVVLATLSVQAVFFVWDMGRSLLVEQRKLLAAFWLLSAAVLLQAGTIMMAPLTAVQALVFLWLLDRHAFVARYPTFVSLFWLMSLFTAYQILLFLPVVIVVFWKTDLKRWKKLVCIATPLILLVLYTMTNPLILASMLDAGTQNSSLSGGQKLEYILVLWAVGGSVVLSGLGTVGMFIKRRWDLLLSLLLVIIYVSLSYRFYYAILFTPLFIAGVVAAPRVLSSCRVCKVLLGIITIGLFLQYKPSEKMSSARIVAQQLQHIDGLVLIQGSYGHEWQYELKQAPRRYKEEWIDQAAVVVCLGTCDIQNKQWHTIDALPVEVWVEEE
jgi:hypothetical protein